jgi:hypothetical protein
MKKLKIIFFSLLALTALAVVAEQGVVIGQATIPSAAYEPVSGADSVLSGGVTAGNLFWRVPAMNHRTMVVQVYARRVSTAMNGKVVLYGSVDGINYTAMSSADSIHISNAATDTGDKMIIQSLSGTAYPNNGVPCKYYKAVFTQIAGDTCYGKIKVYFRQ